MAAPLRAPAPLSGGLVLLRWTANLMIGTSLLALGGFAVLVGGPRDGASELERVLAAVVASVVGSAAPATIGQPERVVLPPAPPSARPITRVMIDRLGLDAEVVPARLLEREDGVITWEVPPFKVGHAQATAGAGEPGVAVLLGHVGSLRSGDVFRDLDRARVDDLVRVLAGAEEFEYRVLAIQRVARTSGQPLVADGVPALVLVTCTGTWLPAMWDFSERLLVRAEVVGRAA